MANPELTLVFGDDGRIAGYVSVSESGDIEALDAHYQRLSGAQSEDEARSLLRLSLIHI